MNRTPKIILTSLGGLMAAASLLSWPALADSGGMVSRDYTWHSDRLVLDVPARVHFQSAPTWHLTIRGPERTLERLRISDGQIRPRAEHHFLGLFGFSFGSDLATVDVDLSGPALREVTINGSGRLLLSGVRQDDLTVRIHGSGTVEGDGNVHDLVLRIDGSGHIHLARLTETHARVSISGSGQVDIAPTGTVAVRIAGSGEVRLHSHPEHVSSHVAGSGGVVELPAAAAGNGPSPPPG